MASIVIYEINADPLGVSNVTILNAYTVNIIDDDTLLEGSEAGAQLDLSGVPGITDSSNFQVFETYSGTLGSDPVSFTLVQYSTPTYIIATQGSFTVGDTITGTNNNIVPAPSSTYSTLPDFVCFTSETLLETPNGPRAIDTLKVGDLVLTADGAAKPIRWIGHRTLSPAELDENPHLRPILIEPDAVGAGAPHAPVRVSPQHRIALSTGASGMLLNADAVLVAAKFLVGHPGIRVDDSARAVRYIHLLFDAHELVETSGLWSESLFLGDVTIGAIPDITQHELVHLFPGFRGDLTIHGSSRLPIIAAYEARAMRDDFGAYVPPREPRTSKAG